MLNWVSSRKIYTPDKLLILVPSASADGIFYPLHLQDAFHTRFSAFHGKSVPAGMKKTIFTLSKNK